MSEATVNAAKALSDWPIWQAIFLVVVVGAGWYFRYLGMRDKKAGFGGSDMPMYLIAHDIAKDVQTIKLILEDIRNNQEFRPHKSKPL